MLKKGFTLIEVLASIAIVFLITSLVLTNLSKVDKDRRKQEFENLVMTIRLSAEDFAGSNGTLLNNIYNNQGLAKAIEAECDCNPSGNNKVTIQELLTNGYLRGNDSTKGRIIDPRSNDDITDKYYISFCYSNDDVKLLKSKLCEVGN